MSSSLVEEAMVCRRCCIFCAVLHHAEGEVLAARAAGSTSPLLLLSQSTLPTPVVEAMMCRRCCNLCVVSCLAKGYVPFTRTTTVFATNSPLQRYPHQPVHIHGHRIVKSEIWSDQSK
ncbi:hypothetical protein PIB30_045843 [Stylosanthes scabra]|uniref:Secreted protein n=1 Tax=Stylosanthes scabra TaxID=79078 RepID=A0ABU6VHR1_9FABA|nr:hypothetical protein [Stylosanthes scabra]